MDIDSLLLAGDTRRWHTVPGLDQTVAEHSWGVAMCIAAKYPNASAELLRAALLHDIHEIDFGDVPSPVKQRCPDIAVHEETFREEFYQKSGLKQPELTAEEKKILTSCDQLEALVFVSRPARREKHHLFVKSNILDGFASRALEENGQ